MLYLIEKLLLFLIEGTFFFFPLFLFTFEGNEWFEKGREVTIMAYLPYRWLFCEISWVEVECQAMHEGKSLAKSSSYDLGKNMRVKRVE